MAQQRGRARRPNASSRARSNVATAVPDSPPRSAKGMRTRRRLLDAAREVFERDGFLDARIADIADTADVSHGTFYHYFDSKEQIFREVAEEQEVSLLTMGGADSDADPLERIRMGNREYLTAYIESSSIMRVIEEVSRYDDDVQAVRSARDDEFAERLESAIARLQEYGMADPNVDPVYAANALGCMVSRFAELYVRLGRFELEKAVDQLTLLWANAIGLNSTND